eukprot:509160-Rhodomonas_salina.1
MHERAEIWPVAAYARSQHTLAQYRTSCSPRVAAYASIGSSIRSLSTGHRVARAYQHTPALVAAYARSVPDIA